MGAPPADVRANAMAAARRALELDGELADAQMAYGSVLWLYEWDWQAASGTVKCPCHFSEFDLKAGARVLNGPAQRRLPALPLKIADGAPAVAAGFVGRPGFESGG